jgi:hypothetical protein
MCNPPLIIPMRVGIRQVARLPPPLGSSSEAQLPSTVAGPLHATMASASPDADRWSAPDGTSRSLPEPEEGLWIRPLKDRPPNTTSKYLGA